MQLKTIKSTLLEWMQPMELSSYIKTEEHLTPHLTVKCNIVNYAREGMSWTNLRTSYCEFGISRKEC